MHPLLASFSVSLCLLLSLSLVGEYVETQMLCHAQFLPVHCLSVLASIRLYFFPPFSGSIVVSSLHKPCILRHKYSFLNHYFHKGHLSFFFPLQESRTFEKFLEMCL